MNDGELKSQTEETSADLKAKINAMKSGKDITQTESAQNGVETVDVTPEASAQSTPEKAPKPTAELDTAPEKSGQADNQSMAPTDKKGGKPEIDHREWARRKGIKDEESALKSLRELERELSRKNVELKAMEAKNVPQGTPPPQWQPTPQYIPPQAPYYPPPPQYPYPPMDRQKILEQEAARYNMLPDDFEKVLALSNDIAGINARRIEATLRAQYDAKLSEFEKENRRNSEMRELMQDPLFAKEEVQFEMHKVLEENPKALDLEPMPRIWAFNEALRRMARRNLQEGRSAQDDAGTKSIPSKPPTEGSRGGVPGFDQNTDATLIEKFNKGSAEDMKKILTSIGARPTL